MNLWQYIKDNKKTIFFFQFGSGVIFTIIFAIIFFLKEGSSGAFLGILISTLILLGLGQAQAFFIVIVATISSFRNYKKSLAFFRSIPEEITRKYNLDLLKEHKDYRLYFSTYSVFSTSHLLIRPEPANNLVRLSILLDYGNSDDFEKYSRVHDKNPEGTVLGPNGLIKYVEDKEWKGLNEIEKIELVNSFLSLPEKLEIPILDISIPPKS